MGDATIERRRRPAYYRRDRPAPITREEGQLRLSRYSDTAFPPSRVDSVLLSFPRPRSQALRRSRYRRVARYRRLNRPADNNSTRDGNRFRTLSVPTFLSSFLSQCLGSRGGRVLASLFLLIALNRSTCVYLRHES